MIIAKNDEEKRSKIWTIVFTVSSVLIVLIAIYLLVKLFTANPLEGRWQGEDGNYNMVVRSNDSLTVTIPATEGTEDVSVKLDYELDMDEKIIAISADDKEVAKAQKDAEGILEENELDNYISSFSSTFAYSVDGETLTLTEREYGEQIRFEKE